MRAVVQRVARAHVDVEGSTVGQIERGLLILIGCGRGDTAQEAQWLSEKIAGLRVFENEAGKMDLNVIDIGGSLLIVSQFTLYGDITRGRRPSFDGALAKVEARALYETFVELCRAHAPVQTGIFEAHMTVHLLNDGPVTLILDTPDRLEPGSST